MRGVVAMSDSDDRLHCWRCSYDLCGFGDDTVCPECGLLVSIARQEAPLIIGSRAQKWAGILALLSFVPMVILGFTFYLAVAFGLVGHDIGMYGAVSALTFASIAGVASGWFMKVSKHVLSVSAYASMALCAAMFLWLWPARILIASSGLGNTWVFTNNVLFLILTMCALGSLALQAKVFVQKIGMDEPAKHNISFRQISSLAFVSAGLMTLGGILVVVSNLFPLTSRLPSLIVGFGMLLGILPWGIWVICLCPIIYRLARWPVGERLKSVRA
jgi:hypothetical protein